MALNLSDILVIGVSSTALFNLEKENEVFVKEGIIGYRKYQQDNENARLESGTAFHLVHSFLHLNAKKKIVEVVVMSRNSPETGVRLMNLLRDHKFDITRIALSGREPSPPDIDAFDIDLSLSKDEKDVQTVKDSKSCAAAFIYDPPTKFIRNENRVKIAFDTDAVLFSDDSEIRYKT